MPDWTSDLRARLAGPRFAPAREAEIVGELSQHLDDRYEELRAVGTSDTDARRLALEELSEAGGLAARDRPRPSRQRRAARRFHTHRPGYLEGD